MAVKRTTILAEADLLDRLDRYCRQGGTTKTAVIAAALKAYLDEHAAPPELPFVAIGRSGHGRLSLDAHSIVRRELGSAESLGGRPSGRSASLAAGPSGASGVSSPSDVSGASSPSGAAGSSGASRPRG